MLVDFLPASWYRMGKCSDLDACPCQRDGRAVCQCRVPGLPGEYRVLDTKEPATRGKGSCVCLPLVSSDVLQNGGMFWTTPLTRLLEGFPDTSCMSRRLSMLFNGIRGWLPRLWNHGVLIGVGMFQWS